MIEIDHTVVNKIVIGIVTVVEIGDVVGRGGGGGGGRTRSCSDSSSRDRDRNDNTQVAVAMAAEMRIAVKVVAETRSIEDRVTIAVVVVVDRGVDVVMEDVDVVEVVVVAAGHRLEEGAIREIRMRAG